MRVIVFELWNVPGLGLLSWVKLGRLVVLLFSLPFSLSIYSTIRGVSISATQIHTWAGDQYCEFVCVQYMYDEKGRGGNGLFFLSHSNSHTRTHTYTRTHIGVVLIVPRKFSAQRATVLSHTNATRLTFAVGISVMSLFSI